VTWLQVAPTSLSLQTGQKDTLSVLKLLFENSQTGVKPLGSTQLSFGSTPPGFVSLTDSVVTAVQAGSTKVNIKVASGLSSSYQRGSVMEAFGEEIPVTVTDPPPPSGKFKVTDITGVPQPITTTGTYQFHAVVAGVPASSLLTVRWQIIYSIGINGAPDTVNSGWVSQDYLVPVHSGSYNIRVTATPRAYLTISGIYVLGGAYIEDFPVCTGGGGGGGGDLAAPEPGDNGTDAVGGC
jgi:hypothetical protein